MTKVRFRTFHFRRSVRVVQWKAFYESMTTNKEPKTGPADFAQDLELFAEMARLMREP